MLFGLVKQGIKCEGNASTSHSFYWYDDDEDDEDDDAVDFIPFYSYWTKAKNNNLCLGQRS